MSNTYTHAQLAYDHRSPDEDDGREEFIEGQVEMLLNADDSNQVEFFDFAELADEKIAEADDREFAVVQLILAVRRGDFTLAEKMALRFEDALIAAATKLVEKELEGEE